MIRSVKTMRQVNKQVNSITTTPQQTIPPRFFNILKMFGAVQLGMSSNSEITSPNFPGKYRFKVMYSISERHAHRCSVMLNYVIPSKPWPGINTVIRNFSCFSSFHPEKYLVSASSRPRPFPLHSSDISGMMAPSVAQKSVIWLVKCTLKYVRGRSR
jgi:hypothetical protein